MDELFKFQVSKDNDLYVFPPLPPRSPLANSGLHISHHASGESHVKVQKLPISCLFLGPKLKLPFSRTEFIEDVVAKKQSLFSEIDLTNENKPGIVAVLKTESVINNFLNSTDIKNWLEDPRYIDYYNLVKTNPYYPSSHFKESFPYKGIEIDAQPIEDAIKMYEGDNLHKLFVNLRNNKSIEDADLVSLIPYDESFFINMSGNGMGLKIDLNNLEDIIEKLPGAKPLYDVFKKLT